MPRQRPEQTISTGARRGKAFRRHRDLADRAGRRTRKARSPAPTVLLQNLKPGSMDKLGFSRARLRKDYPALISAPSRLWRRRPLRPSQGLRPADPGRKRARLDHRRPGRPSRVGFSIVDIATGATAHAAILEALIGRSRTRQRRGHPDFDVRCDGRLARVPLLNSEAGNAPQRLGLAHLDRALRRVPLQGWQRHPDFDPERARVEEALRGRAGPAGAAERSPTSNMVERVRNRAAHRRDRRRQLCHHDPRRVAANVWPTPTSPSPKSTPWPIWRRPSRICAPHRSHSTLAARLSYPRRRHDRHRRQPRTYGVVPAIGERPRDRNPFPQSSELVETRMLELDHQP